MATLTERRAAILQLIVNDYIDNATPVGSETIVRKYGLKVSPATIRNEMVKLEEEGYLTQPHTSAGRVPSDLGYRYYVETLMGEEDLSPDEKRQILHQFHQAAAQMDAWLDLAAAVLARSVRNLALVTAPRSPRVHFRHAEIVSLESYLALLVLVLREVHAKEQVLMFPEPVTQEELWRTANQLNEELAGLTAPEIRARQLELTRLGQQALEAVLRLMEAEDSTEFPSPRLSGLRNVLSQPEFSNGEKMLGVLDVLEERNLSRAIPLDRIAEEGVTVIIGAENRQDAMRECSVVITRYGVPGWSGTLGILGPTRMHYPRAISTVRYLASVLTELVDRWKG
ncbi:MAG TPA: heat-inducible transcriptional repressor HrcA [Dehalococcoidia bacterium]